MFICVSLVPRPCIPPPGFDRFTVSTLSGMYAADWTACIWDFTTHVKLLRLLRYWGSRRLLRWGKGFVTFTTPDAPPPTWSNHIHTQTSVISFANVTESCDIVISVITRLLGLKKRVFPRLADNTDNMQSQDKHWGSLGVLSQARPSTELLL